MKLDAEGLARQDHGRSAWEVAVEDEHLFDGAAHAVGLLGTYVLEREAVLLHPAECRGQVRHDLLRTHDQDHRPAPDTIGPSWLPLAATISMRPSSVTAWTLLICTSGAAPTLRISFICGPCRSCSALYAECIHRYRGNVVSSTIPRNIVNVYSIYEDDRDLRRRRDVGE